MRLAPGILALAAAALLSGATLIDQGELHCEEAVNHLADCCHGPVGVYSCTAGRGCDEGRPDLDDPLATTIRDESCDELVASGACQRPPKSPEPPPDPCSGWFQSSCYDASMPPPDFAVDDLAPPADLSTVDGASGDGP